MTKGVEHFIFGYSFIRFARRVDKKLAMTKQLTWWTATHTYKNNWKIVIVILTTWGMIFSLLFSLDDTLQYVIFCGYLTIHDFPIAVWLYLGYLCIIMSCFHYFVSLSSYFPSSYPLFLPNIATIPRIMMKRSLFQSSRIYL